MTQIIDYQYIEKKTYDKMHFKKLNITKKLRNV